MGADGIAIVGEKLGEIGEIAGLAQCEGDHGGDLDDDQDGGEVERDTAEIAVGLVVVGIGLPEHRRKIGGNQKLASLLEMKNGWPVSLRSARNQKFERGE